MSDAVQIHVIRRGDLVAGRTPALEDPTGFATLSPLKRAALLENPLLTDDSEPVQLLGSRGGIAIGRIDLISGRVIVRNEPVTMLWGSEWSVPEEHRASMVGVFLLLKLQQTGFNLGAHGPSQMALPVYNKLKWRDMPMSRWIMLRRSRPVVERYFGKGPHAVVASVIANLGLAVFGMIAAGRISSMCDGLEALASEQFPLELEGILETGGRVDHRKVLPYRSAAWINWLLTHRFENDARTQRRLILIERRGRVVGYALLKVKFFPVATSRGFRNLLLGSVQDWMSFDGGVSDEQMMLMGVLEVAKMGVDAVEVCSPTEQIDGRLKSLGFIRAGSFHLMYKPTAGSPLVGVGSTLESWRVRQVDGDNFLF